MARVTVEDCLEQIPNRFALVLLASSRTRQLMKGSRSLVDSQRNKEPVTALREVAERRVYFDRPVNDVLDKTLNELQADFESLHSSDY
mgnify:CR=1 FL=1